MPETIALDRAARDALRGAARAFAPKARGAPAPAAEALIALVETGAGLDLEPGDCRDTALTLFRPFVRLPSVTPLHLVRLLVALGRLLRMSPTWLHLSVSATRLLEDYRKSHRGRFDLARLGAALETLEFDRDALVLLTLAPDGPFRGWRAEEVWPLFEGEDRVALLCDLLQKKQTEERFLHLEPQDVLQVVLSAPEVPGPLLATLERVLSSTRSKRTRAAVGEALEVIHGERSLPRPERPAPRPVLDPAWGRKQILDDAAGQRVSPSKLWAAARRLGWRRWRPDDPRWYHFLRRPLDGVEYMAYLELPRGAGVPEGDAPTPLGRLLFSDAPDADDELRNVGLSRVAPELLAAVRAEVAQLVSASRPD